MVAGVGRRGQRGERHPGAVGEMGALEPELPGPPGCARRTHRRTAPWSGTRPPTRRPGPGRSTARKRPAPSGAAPRTARRRSTRPAGGAAWWPNTTGRRGARSRSRTPDRRPACRTRRGHRCADGDTAADAGRRAQGSGRGTPRVADQGCTMGRQARAVHISRSVSTFASVALVSAPDDQPRRTASLRLLADAPYTLTSQTPLLRVPARNTRPTG